jgi:hypothetical protein
MNKLVDLDACPPRDNARICRSCELRSCLSAVATAFRRRSGRRPTAVRTRCPASSATQKCDRGCALRLFELLAERERLLSLRRYDCTPGRLLTPTTCNLRLARAKGRVDGGARPSSTPPRASDLPGSPAAHSDSKRHFRGQADLDGRRNEFSPGEPCLNIGSRKPGGAKRENPGFATDTRWLKSECLERGLRCPRAGFGTAAR